MSSHDDDVGGGPCHIDRSPAGLVSSRPLAPQGRSVLSDSVSPISAIPPRGAAQVESQRYSFGYPPGRCPGLVKCYRGRHGRDAIRIEHHHGRTRGFRFLFLFYGVNVGLRQSNLSGSGHPSHGLQLQDNRAIKAYRHIQSLRDGLFETWTRWLIQPLGWAFLRNACSCLHWKHGGSTTMGGPTHPLTYKLRHSKDIQRTLSALTPSFSPLGLSFSDWAATYVECPLHGRNLFRHQDDIEGIHLRLREVDGPIPQIPAVRAMVFGSSGRRCIGA